MAYRHGRGPGVHGPHAGDVLRAALGAAVRRQGPGGGLHAGQPARGGRAEADRSRAQGVVLRRGKLFEPQHLHLRHEKRCANTGAVAGGARRNPTGTAAKDGPNWMFEALAQRVRFGELRYRLLLQIGVPGQDPTNDPTLPWPPDRRQIDAGTLVLGHAIPREQEHIRDTNFDPTVLPTGIELSDDPISRRARRSTPNRFGGVRGRRPRRWSNSGRTCDDGNHRVPGR